MARESFSLFFYCIQVFGGGNEHHAEPVILDTEVKSLHQRGYPSWTR